MKYANGTEIINTIGSFAQPLKGKAICEDGKLRCFRITGYCRSFGEIPAKINCKRKTVSGFISFEHTSDQIDYQVIFTSVGKNAYLIPKSNP